MRFQTEGRVEHKGRSLHAVFGKKEESQCGWEQGNTIPERSETHDDI